MIELNRIVGALRRDEHELLDRQTSRAWTTYPNLVGSARAAGLQVRPAVAGHPRTLPSAVELAACPGGSGVADQRPQVREIRAGQRGAQLLR